MLALGESDAQCRVARCAEQTCLHAPLSLALLSMYWSVLLAIVLRILTIALGLPLALVPQDSSVMLGIAQYSLAQTVQILIVSSKVRRGVVCWLTTMITVDRKDHTAVHREYLQYLYRQGFLAVHSSDAALSRRLLCDPPCACS